MLLTINALPHEIVLRILECLEIAVLKDRMEEERQREEAAHQQHLQQHHQHDGANLNGGLGGPGGAANPLLDLFGFLQGGPPPANAAGNNNANVAAAGHNAGAAGNAPNGQNAANGLFGAFGGLFGVPGVNGQDDSTDDEMPPLEAAGASAPPNAPNGTAQAASESDDEMPPLETIDGTVVVSTNNTSPPPENAAPTASTAAAPTASELPAPVQVGSVIVGDSSDEDEDTDTAPPPHTIVLPPHLEAVLMPSDPETPATGSITGSLAHELEAMLSPTLSGTELDTIPEMGPDHEDDGWSTEDEEGNLTDEANDEADIDDDDDETESEGSVIQTSAGPREAVTYEDGLPACPFLPTASINRSFLGASRTQLYGQHIHLSDVYQAHLFHRTLTSGQVSVHDDEPEADDDEKREEQKLGWLVRDIGFDIRKQISLGRGGASLIVDIIKLCPRLERFGCSADLLKSATKPLTDALIGATQMKSVSLRGGAKQDKDLIWSIQTLQPLLMAWPKLQNLQILWLKNTRGSALPHTWKCTLNRLSLAYCDISDAHLSDLLRASKDSLVQLEIHHPTKLLTRKGIAKAIIDHGKQLQILQFDIDTKWHETSEAFPPAISASCTAEAAAASRYLMDGLIGHLPVLAELKLSGNLASTILLARLPKSIAVLAFEDNYSIDLRKVIALFKKKRKVMASSTGKPQRTIPAVAPKLSCFTLCRSDGSTPQEHIARDLEKTLEARKACVHWNYYSPASVWRPDGAGLDGMAAAAAAAAGLGMMAPLMGGIPPEGFPFGPQDFPFPF